MSKNKEQTIASMLNGAGMNWTTAQTMAERIINELARSAPEEAAEGFPFSAETEFADNRNGRAARFAINGYAEILQAQAKQSAPIKNVLQVIEELAEMVNAEIDRMRVAQRLGG